MGYDKERAQYNLGVACKAMFLEKRLILSLVTYDLLASTKQRAVNQYNGTIINNFYDDRSARLSVTYKFGRKEIKARRESKEAQKRGDVRIKCGQY